MSEKDEEIKQKLIEKMLKKRKKETDENDEILLADGTILKVRYDEDH